MPLATGMFSYVGVGQESTWGTTVTRTKFMELVSESVKLEVARQFSESLRGPSKRRWFNGKRFVQGDLILELGYEGFEVLMKHLFGKVTSSNLTSPAVQHLMEFPDPDVIFTGLSIEIERDLQAFLYAGCKITKAVFAAELDRILKCTLSIIGKEETQVAATTPTYPGEYPVLWSQLVAKIDAVGGPGVALDVRSFEVTIDNAFDSDRRALGNSLIKEPTRAGMRAVTGQLVADWEDMTQYNRYANGTEFMLQFAFTGAAIGASGVNQTFQIDLPRCIATGTTPNVSEPGPVRLTLPFEALCNASGSIESAKITMKSAVTSPI